MTAGELVWFLTFEYAESRDSHPDRRLARVLRQIAVLGLFADVVLLVVAMALGGVERNAGRAAGALVALVVLGDGRCGLSSS